MFGTSQVNSSNEAASTRRSPRVRGFVSLSDREEAIAASPSEFMMLCIARELTDAGDRLDAWKWKWHEEEIRQPDSEPDIYHSCFPELIFCRRCSSAKGVVKKWSMTDERWYFTCASCNDPSTQMELICWDDDVGVLPDNPLCDCQLPSRKQTAVFCIPAGKEYLCCAVGGCDFWKWNDQVESLHSDLEVLSLGQVA